MKTLVKVLSVLLVFGIVVASCQKDDDITNLEAKKGQVSINLSTDQMNATPQKAGACKASVVRPESFPVFVDRMTIDAQAAAGLVSEEFTFTDEGEGIVQMSPYLGMNTFTATAHPKAYVKNPYDTDGDGFFTSYAYPASEASITNAVNNLRKANPYIIFTGEASKLITEAPETVDMNMATLNGRLIATFEMIQGTSPLAVARYIGVVNVSTPNGVLQGSPKPIIGGVTADPESGWYESTIYAYMYLSNADCVAGKKVTVSIDIYEVADTDRENLLRTITLTEAQAKKLEIIPGIDRSVKMKVSADGQVFISDASFTFTWDWNTQDDDITIE